MRYRSIFARVVACSLSLAQVASAAESPPPAAVLPPSLTSRAEAVYPADALRDRLEATVGLELSIDAAGHVAAARVTSSGGHSFDAAALAAAAQFVFSPASRGGVAIGSTIELAYDFKLPPAAPAVPAPAPAPTPEPLQTGTDQSTLVLAQRPISAASSMSVRDRDFELRPVGSVTDILRVTPGLVMVQHSGGGKANQYFIRGFDADHGSDLALSIDGVPINMVSHAHGQGFSDTNFIIPEVVSRVEITKGPYFANQGDFATAGAVNLVSRDSFEHSSFGFGVSGSPGYGQPGYRALAIASPMIAAGVHATFAAEVGRSNGPFEHPDKWGKYKLFTKLAYATGDASSLTVTHMSYGGDWHGSGQVPARAIEQNIVSRFGALDPSEGGATTRHQLALQYKLRPTAASEFKVLAYVGSYDFDLYSNFTQALRDPDRGDEIQQIDRRSFYGGKASYRAVHSLGAVRFDTTLGTELRADAIHQELWNTAARQQLLQVRGSDVGQTTIGAYLSEEIALAAWLRIALGGRADQLSYAVNNTVTGAAPGEPSSGASAARQLSPKASLVVTPLQKKSAEVDVYVNYGHGLHSNDVRGAFSASPVSPLARAVGEEIGARARLWQKWDIAAALWQLDLASETVWNGDAGTTSVGGATTRRGAEVETRYELTKWLAADLDLTFTQSALTTNGGNGSGLALAPKRTWAGGLSGRAPLGPGVLRGGLRFFGIADRPATDDGALVAPGFTEVDMHVGYRHRRFDVALDVENLLNSEFRSAQFATTSRLPGEPPIGSAVPAGFSCGSAGRLVAGPVAGRFYGCEDVAFTPAYPLTLRVTWTVFLD